MLGASSPPNDGKSRKFAPSPAVQRVAWRVMCWRGAALDDYVKASLVGTCRDSTSQLPVNSGHFGLGLVWASDHGDADELAGYDRALSPSRVVAHLDERVLAAAARPQQVPRGCTVPTAV